MSMIMLFNRLLSSSFLNSLKFTFRIICVVLKLNFPRNRETVSGSLTSMPNSLTSGSLCNSFIRSSLSMPRKLPQRSVLIWFILIFSMPLSAKVISLSSNSNKPSLLAWLSSSNSPALDVRFFALKSILLIMQNLLPTKDSLPQFYHFPDPLWGKRQNLAFTQWVKWRILRRD